MTDLIFAVLAIAFLCLVSATVSFARHPHAPAHLCAVASLTVTCGDVR